MLLCLLEFFMRGWLYFGLQHLKLTLINRKPRDSMYIISELNIKQNYFYSATQLCHTSLYGTHNCELLLRNEWMKGQCTYVCLDFTFTDPKTKISCQWAQQYSPTTPGEMARKKARRYCSARPAERVFLNCSVLNYN